MQALLQPDMDAETRLAYVAPVTQAWRDLEAELLGELESEGFRRDQITLHQVAYVRYFGQLDDVEVDSPVAQLDTEADLAALIQAFEDLYAQMFTLAARPDQGTYHITEVCVIAKVATVKPKLRKHELADPKPDTEACKGSRPVFMRGKWNDADIWRMESLRPGNEIDGLAVIEASNTTLFVPPEWRVRIDENDVYWLTRKDAK
ncbi:MAG TPA: hypothetical protein ENO23_10565 [Alphaproteobacteria bacterium]|nr:hypothetical protein [Alphaproteobacteria bacterium]